MTESTRNTLPKPAYCPHCGKNLPEELRFCPYCMKRTKEATVIKLPEEKKRNKKLIVIPVAILLIAIILLLFVFLEKTNSENNNKTTNSSDTETYDDTTNNNADAGITVTDGNNVNIIIDNNGNTDTPPNENGFNNSTESESIATKNNYTTNKTVNNQNNLQTTLTNAFNNSGNITQPETQTSNFTPSPDTDTDTGVSIPQMVGRWNAANSNLGIHNFHLSGYSSQDYGNSCSISQKFSNSGADMNFTFNQNLGSYTLNVNNIANLNIMYQICRISLAAVAGEAYSDSTFYDFISSSLWETENTDTEIKTGIFAGYRCTVTLVTHTNIDQWGLTYTRYSCTLIATKI